MSKIGSFNQSDLGKGTVSDKGPGTVVAGTPEFTTFMYEQGRAKVGVWQVTQGSYRMEYGENAYEVFTLLEGVVEIAEDGGETKTYRAGETVIIRANFRGTWRTIETVKKVFVSL